MFQVSAFYTAILADFANVGQSVHYGKILFEDIHGFLTAPSKGVRYQFTATSLEKMYNVGAFIYTTSHVIINLMIIFYTSMTPIDILVNLPNMFITTIKMLFFSMVTGISFVFAPLIYYLFLTENPGEWVDITEMISKALIPIMVNLPSMFSMFGYTYELFH